MSFKQEFEDGLRKYRRLNLAWATSTTLLVAAYMLVPLHWMLGAALFFIGAFNLGAAGVSCAYVIARDNA